MHVEPVPQVDPNSVFSLPEPLVPIGTPTVADTAALVEALKAVKLATNPQDYSPLVEWAEQHPESAWYVAVVTNLGIVEYKSGYFSRSLERLTGAWSRGAQAETPRQKALVDRAIGELLRMHARLGHMQEIRQLLDEVEGRTFRGGAAQLVLNTQEALWLMENEPEYSFRCGPLALQHIAVARGVPASSYGQLTGFFSTHQGTTLLEISDHAREAALGYEAVYREARNEPVPVPSIVHWKVNHFAAIVGYSDGRYHIKDPTFGGDLWITADALNAESSGYYLIDAAVVGDGWRIVDAGEAQEVRGAGTTRGNDDDRYTPDDDKECCEDQPGPNGLARYSVHTMLVNLSIQDRPISYSPPRGPPINVDLTYNYRDQGRAAFPSYTHFGPGWTSNWISFIEDDSTTPEADVRHYVRGGGWRTYKGNLTGHVYGRDGQTNSEVTRVSDSPIKYERLLSDGSKEIYESAVTGTPRRVFLTTIVDPFGNTITLNYSAPGKLEYVEDPLGQKTYFYYDNGGYQVTRIRDPFTREATLGYDGQDRLSDITDPESIETSFGFHNSTSDLITSLVTPYGTTSFTHCDSVIDPTNCPVLKRRIVVTSPNSERTQIEYTHLTPGVIPATATGLNAPPPEMDVARNALLSYRNTFVWGHKAMAGVTPPNTDYDDAHIIHWLHRNDVLVPVSPADTFPNLTAGIKESEKRPGENRVWYQYPTQKRNVHPDIVGGATSDDFPPHVSDGAYTGTGEQPIRIGRYRPDGTSSQIFWYRYNKFGKVTRYVDPVGNELRYTYAANGVDLLKVRRLSTGTTVISDDLTATTLGSDWVARDLDPNASGSYTATTSGLTLDSNRNFNDGTNYEDTGMMVCRRIPDVPAEMEVTMTTTTGLGTTPRLLMLRSSLHPKANNIQIRLNTSVDGYGLAGRFAYGQVTLHSPNTPSAVSYDDSLPVTVAFEYDGEIVKSRVDQGSGFEYLKETDSPSSDDIEVRMEDLRWVCLTGTSQSGSGQTYRDFSMEVPTYEEPPLMEFTYNANHQPLTYTDALENTWTYTYNGFGQIKTLTDPLSNQREWFYDGDGYLQYIENALDEKVVEYDYDAAGRIDVITDGNGRELDFDYDDLNRVTKITHDDATFEDFDYGVYNGPAPLHLAKYTDRLSNETTYTYTALGQIDKITNELTHETDPEYCLGCGGLSSVEDPIEHATSYERDLQNRVTEDDSEDRGLREYEYDVNGNLWKVTDAKSVVATLAYDAADRLLEVDYTGTAEDTAYVYDTYTGCANGIGRLCHVSDPSGSTTYDYYRDGLLKTETRVEAGATYVTSYEYDDARRVTKITPPSGVALTFVPDDVGRIESISAVLGTGSVNVLDAVAYYPTDQLKSQTFGNWLTESRFYDGDGRLESIESTDSDLDEDSMSDWWEVDNGFDPGYAADAGTDADSDGLTNLEEFLAETDPNNDDTDGDGRVDGADVNPLLNEGTWWPAVEHLLD